MTVEEQYVKIHTTEFVFKDEKIKLLEDVLDHIERNYKDLNIKDMKDFVWYNAGINYCISVINSYIIFFKCIEKEKEGRNE